MFQIVCSQGASRHCSQTRARVVLLRRSRIGHFFSSLLSETSQPVFSSYSLTVPLTNLFFSLASSLFRNQPVCLYYLFFSGAGSIRTGCVGNIRSRTLIYLVSRFLSSPHLSAVVAQHYHLGTFFLLQVSLFAYTVSISGVFISLA